MIDFHKGFEEYESLGRGKPEKKEEKVSLSRGSDKAVFLEDGDDLSQIEAFYNEVRTFIKGQFDLVITGNEKKINFSLIMEYAEKICIAMDESKTPGAYLRLVFEHDEYQDSYIYTHSVNVCFLCLRIALELNFSRKRLKELAICSLFHDIGMMKIPMNIWNKEGSLTSDEYKKVQEHPFFGEGLFTNIEGISEVVPLVIGQHQEKVDGSGYPGHLTIDNIHYLARLISLVDGYETQTHTRRWKKKSLPDKTMQDLLDHQTGKFDPHFMKALLRVSSIYPEGTFVRISSGEICKVVATNKDKPMRPIVALIYDNSMKRIAGSRILDLSKQMLLHVEKCIDPSNLSQREGLYGK